MKKHILVFSSIAILVFAAAACSMPPTNTSASSNSANSDALENPAMPANTTEPEIPAPTEIASEVFGPDMISINTTAETTQGRIDYPYKTADAGNFILLAGETISFTWLDFPPGASFYTIAVESYEGDQLIMIGSDFESSDGVSVVWEVQERISGTVVGFACMEDGTCIGTANWSGIIHTGALPPEEYCSAMLFNFGVRDIYLAADETSPVMGYMIPLNYTQVYAISADEWMWIDMTGHEYTAEEYNGIERGYIPLQGSIELFGPCDTVQEN